MRASRHLLPTFILLVAVCGGPGFAQQEEAPSPASPFSAALKRGFELISEGEYSKARKELEAAQALKEGPCGECLLGLSHVYAADKEWEQAEEAVRQAISLLKEPHALARAYNQLGVALAQSRSRGGKAEEAFRQAAALGGPWGDLARYNLAQALMKTQRWAEAAEAARGYLQVAGPEGTALREARITLCQARYHLQNDLPPQEPNEPQEPRRVGGEVKRPEILHQVIPEMPPEARAAKTRGTVILETVIDREGCVGDIEVLKGLPNGLSEAASRSVRRWVFTPATLQGRPVDVFYVLTVNFQVWSTPGARRRPGS